MDLRRFATFSRWLGPAVAVVASVFVVRVLTREWPAAREALGNASLRWIAAAAVLALAAMVAMALPWRRVLRLLDVGASLPAVVAMYFAGEIGKYLPGGVWPVVGRGELAHRAGVARSSAYASVALSLVTLYLGAAVTGAALLLLPGAGSTPGVAFMIVPLAVAGMVLLHPRLLVVGLNTAGRLVRRPLALEPPRWRSSLGLVALYVPAWALVATATWCVARSLEPAAGLVDVGGAAVVSWLAGFLVLGVPGGVGVREATFVALAGGIPAGAAVATAVVARLLFVAVDAAGALVALPGLRGKVSATDDGPPPSSTEEDGGPR
ncbi:MAG: flippase-like domain-containing protein [Actinobacteria bacterium]|nr:flippase-like domain-containing protein [Actinomycetota bacterium]